MSSPHPQDIRAYFPVLGSKSRSDAGQGTRPSTAKTITKKTKRILDSDDEDPMPPKKKITTIDLDDSDDEIFESKKRTDVKNKINPASTKSLKKKNKTPTPVKPLKLTSAASFFSSSPVSRKEANKADKQNNEECKRAKRKTVDGVSDEDVAFKKTLQQLDQPHHTPKKPCPTEIEATSEEEKDIVQSKVPLRVVNVEESPPKQNENSPPNKLPAAAGLASKLSAKIRSESPKHSDEKQSSSKDYLDFTRKKAKSDPSPSKTVKDKDSHDLSNSKRRTSPRKNAKSDPSPSKTIKEKDSYDNATSNSGLKSFKKITPTKKSKSSEERSTPKKKPVVELVGKAEPEKLENKPYQVETKSDELESKVKLEESPCSQSSGNKSTTTPIKMSQVSFKKESSFKTPTNNKYSPRSASFKATHKALVVTPNRDCASPDLFLDDSATSAPDTPSADDKKKQQTVAYRKYLQRPGPRNPGSKVIPEGAPGCLSGLTFVQTGVLESLDRHELKELLQRYGAREVTSLSKKVTHLVVGDEPGVSKLAKAEQLRTTVISEDDVLEMIRSRPGDPSAAKAAKTNASSDKKQKAPCSKKEELAEATRPVAPSKSLPALSPPTPKSDGGSLSQDAPSSASEEGSHSQQTQSLSSQELHDRSTEEMMWVDKYKPASLKNIIGQQGDKSNARKLLHWLKSWSSNHNGNKKLARPSLWAKDNDGSFFKAALLSGPPGVGKTTTAQLVCRELGFDTVELNASDTRSKRSLTEEVAQLLSNTSLSNYATGSAGAATSRHHVLLMDEVDGMAGNEDRGGVQELIALLKSSRVPIICMCNDRQHPKIRSLANHCFDLRFYKPRLEQIRGAMMSVCFREGLKLKADALDQIITGSNQDVRQVLHHLSMFSAKEKTISSDQAKHDSQKAKKDLKIGPWDVCRQVFSESERKNMNINQKSDLFFHDYSIGPLFVQENYWKARPKNAHNRVALLKQLSKAANSLADGDLVERAIRTDNCWSLLPTQAVFSCVLPGEAMAGHMAGEIEFPSWLGNNSKKNKMDRLAQEVHMHMRLRISGNKRDVSLEYSKAVRDGIIGPLLASGADGVAASVDAVTDYCLVREDLDSLGDLTMWSGMQDRFARVDSKVKAAFTRALNKSPALNPYSVAAAPKKKRGSASADSFGEEMEYDEGDNDQEDEEDDDVTADAMIKVKKPPTASTSKKGVGGGSSSGRGRSKAKK